MLRVHYYYHIVIEGNTRVWRCF